MLKVLLVDDEPYVLEGLKVMVDWAQYGFSMLFEASNGEDALEIVKLSNPDLVITDIKMPVMDGLEFIRLSIERFHSTAKFVILSGYGDFSYAKQAMLYNVSDYLVKPLDQEELNELSSKMAAKISENKKKAVNTNGQLSFIANQCIRRIIKGEMKASLVNRVSLLLNLGEEEDVSCVLIELESIWGREKTVVATGLHYQKIQKVRQIISDKLGPAWQFNLFEDDMGRFGIIASAGMPFYGSLDAFVSETIRQIASNLGEYPTASVSLSEKGPYSISAIYKQALFALNYKFYGNSGNIILYREVKDLNLNYGLCTQDISLLLELVRNGRNAEIERTVKKLFINFSENLRAPGSVIAYINCFELELIRLIMEMVGNPDDFLRIVPGTEKLMDHLTLCEIEDSFLKHCLYASDYVGAIRQSHPQTVVNEVKNYIKQNYSKDVKLKNVAKVFYMNPVYLGQVFRKTTGMQFNDYLNSVRIEEAKKLLRRSDLKIQEISRLTGFNDPKYFLSKFKSITNLPPSAFKEKA